MEGNTALGASSPAKPAFTRPEPLSHTSAVVSSSSHMVSAVSAGAQGSGAEPHGRPAAAGGGGGAGAYLGWLGAPHVGQRERLPLLAGSLVAAAAAAEPFITAGGGSDRPPGMRPRPSPYLGVGPGAAVPKEGAPGPGPGEPGPAV